MANALTYIRNVGKSIGYVSIDVLKEKNPVFHDFAETNGELASDMYKSVRDLKKNIKDLPNKIMESEYGKFGKTYLDNLFSDLKSGKFYNKEREDQYASEGAEETFDGLDMDVFNDFGEGDSGFDLSELESNKVPSSNEMMDIVGEKSALAVSTAMARSAEYIVESNTQAAKASYKQMNAIYGGIHSGMSTINQNITKLLQFSNENINMHIENSRTFYTEVTRMDQERNQYLKDIADTLKQINEPSKSSTSSSSRKQYGDLVSSEGVLDLSAYGQYLKKSIKDNSGGIFDMIEMVMSTGGLKQLAASPLQFIAENVVKSVIPKALDMSMEKLNKSLTGMVGNALMTLKDKSYDNEIWGMINDIFGIDTNVRSGIDTSKYEKGKVPFDGVTRKAITEVIPTYLSKIYSVLSGQKRDTFDYDTGKFVTVDSLKTRISDMKNTSAKRAGSDMTDVFNEKIKTLKLSKEQEESLREDFNNMIYTMFERQKRFETRDSRVEAHEYNIINEENFETLKKMFDGESSNLAYSNRLYREITDLNKSIERLHDSASITSVYNDSIDKEENNTKNGMASLFGNINNAVVDKLNEIYKELAFIRIYGSGKYRHNNKGKHIKNDLSNFVVPKTMPTSTNRESETPSSNSNKGKDSSDDSDSEGKKTEQLTDDEIIKEESQTGKKKRKTLSERMRDIKKGALGIIQGPLNLAASVIDRVDARLYELVYGPIDGKKIKDEDDDRTLSQILFDNLQNQFDKFSSWMQEKIFDPLTTKSLKENAHDAAEKFLKIFGIDLDETVEGIKKFLLGVDEDGNETKGGFLGKFINDFKSTFTGIKDWIKGGFKEVGDELEVTSKKSETGKNADKLLDLAKSQLNINETDKNKKEKKNKSLKEKIGKKYRGKDGQIYTYTEEDYKNEKYIPNKAFLNYATGARVIQETGPAILSKGELVIPDSMNPFDIIKREQEENKVKQNLGFDDIFQYAEGSTNTLSEKDKAKRIAKNKKRNATDLNPQEFKEIISSYKNEKAAIKYMSKARSQFNDDKKYSEFLKEVKFVEIEGEYDHKSIIHNSLTELLSGIQYTANSIVNNLAISEKDTEKFRENATNFLSDIKEHGGTLAAGATIGAGVSLLTGLVGGPLVGAAVGAGTALITKSKSVQEMLFGNEEEGKNGLLPKNLINTIKKYLPDSAKGGVMGGLLSFIPGIPGGPVAGILVGSALGFAKNNESIQNAIFGHDGFIEDKDKFINSVKSKLPKMGAGALAGLIAGPFGLTTNLLLGSAIGFASDTNLFKDVMFGEEIDGKRTGGIIGSVIEPMIDFFKKSLDDFRVYVKNDILAPVKNAMAPLAKDFKLLTKKIGDTISNFFKESIGQPIERFIKNTIINPVGKFIKNTLGIAIKPLKSMISAPFKLIGRYGDYRRKKHIRSGNADYMGAAQRNAFRKSKGLMGMGGHDDYEEFDTALENVSNDDLSVLRDSFAAVKDARTTHTQTSDEAFKRVRKEIYSEQNGVKTHVAKAALDMVKRGQYAEAIEFVEKSDIQPEAKVRIKTKLASESYRIKMAKEMRDKTGRGASRIAELSKKLGFDIDQERLKTDPKYADQIFNNLEGEMKYREKYQKDPIQELNNDQKKRHDQIVNIITDIRNALVKDKNIDSDDFSRKTKFDRYKEQLESVSEGESTAEEINAVNNEIIKKYNIRGIRSRIRSAGEKSFDDIKKSASEIKYNVSNYIGNVRKDVTESDEYRFMFGDHNKNYYGDPDKVPEISFNERLGAQLRKSYRDAKKNIDIITEEEITEPGKMSKSEQQALKEKIAFRSGGKIISNLNTKQNTGDEKAAEAADRTAKIVATMAAKQGIDLKRIDYNKELGSEITRITSRYKNKKTTQYVDGLPVTYTTDKDGNQIVDNSVAENRETFDKINEKHETQKGILAGLTAIPTSIGNIFGEIFGTEEEKKESIFSKILNFFTGGKLTSGIKTFGSLLKSVLISAIPLALTAAVTQGVFDKIANALTGGAFGSESTTKGKIVKDSDGNNVEIQTDKDGNPITDEDGNYLKMNGESISSDSLLQSTGSVTTMSLSDRLKYNLVRNTITGKGTVIGSILKNNKIVKFGKAITKKVGDVSGISKLVKAATHAGTMDDIISTLLDNTDTFINALKKVPILKKYINEEKLINLSVSIGDLIERYLPKAGASIGKLSKSLSKLALPIAIITAVADFSTGWQDASSILKIKKEDVKLHHKIICGLVRTFKNLIPVVGTFIPDQIITDLFINHVANWFNIDVSEIKNSQKEAQDELDKYNDENETDYNWAEYNKKIKGNYTWTESIGNFFSSKKAQKKQKLSTIPSLPYMKENFEAKGSGLFGRGSGLFISQLDPRYKNKAFNIAGDTQVQTLGDTGCAPAAAAMAINSTLDSQPLTMEEASRLALKYKVKDDGVNASYFNDEFARHGIYANYITSSDANARSQEIYNQLMNNNKVVLMGQDMGNSSKAVSPFGPNPHYVVATGLSKDGKYVFINDPESNRPNIKYSADRIFKSSSLGISASVAKGTKNILGNIRKYAGRGSYGPDTIQYKVWNALRAAGYNEIAVAAAMGNIEAESGFRPEAIEKGSNIGFGLVQWSYGRRTAFENFAKQNSSNPSNLEIQIKYLLKELESNSGIWTKASSKYGFGSLSRNDWANGKDLAKATKAFMCCFERPSYYSSINHIDRRLSAAKEYYEAFTGKAIDVNLNFTTYNTTTTTNTTSKATGFLSELSSAFTNLAKVYGIVSDNDTSTTDYTSPNTPYITTADGNVSTNPKHAALQKALVEKMYSVQGTLKYAQNNAKYPGSRNPEDGSGDCSSTVQWAYKNILGVDPGSWTGAQREDSDTYTVATSTVDESKLQLGDLLLKDGHVEMYAGNNTMIGHGGGKDGKTLGPVISKLNKSGAYNLVRRWVGFKGSGSGLYGRGSEHPTNSAYDNALRHIKSNEFNTLLPFGISEDTLDKNKASIVQYNNNKLSQTNSIKTPPVQKQTGRATQVNTGKEETKSNDLIVILKAILKYVTQIAGNTTAIDNILALISDYFNAVKSDNNNSTQKTKETAILAKQNLINAVQGSSGSSSEPNAQLLRLIEATERIARE